jgi:hypothetical protein
MATIPQNTVVRPITSQWANLRYPPTAKGAFVIAVHPGALKSDDKATQCIQVEGDSLLWIGGISEGMIELADEMVQDARRIIAHHLLIGSALWGIIPHVNLHKSPPIGPTSVYREERPWIVVGETTTSFLAAPLNHLNPEDIPDVYQAPVFETELQAMASHKPKNCKLEMNHIWSLPKTIQVECYLAAVAQKRVGKRIQKYYK